MKRDRSLEILAVLIVLILVVLGISIYEDYYLVDKINKTKQLAINTYQYNMVGYDVVNNANSGDSLYTLYRNQSSYMVKKIDVVNNLEDFWEFTSTYSCKLQNETEEVYITCDDQEKIVVLNINGQEIKNFVKTNKNDYIVKEKNDYVLYENRITDYPNIVSAKCDDACLILKSSEDFKKYKIYQDNMTKTEEFKYYLEYAKGFVTYNSKSLTLYDIFNNSSKEFSMPKRYWQTKVMAIDDLGINLYVYDNNLIRVYNLYQENNFVNIDIESVSLDVKKIQIRGNYLYLFTEELVYVINTNNISSTDNDEDDENGTTNTYEDSLINNKIKYFQDNYNVLVSLENPSYINSAYKIKGVSNYNNIIEALSHLEDYFIRFNKSFFNHFYEYGMDGLEIYFADDIRGTTNGYNNTSVVGLSFKKGTRYIIIVKLNSEDGVSKILAHETMHIIDYYLELKDYQYNWNNYNPSGFQYSHTYYMNETFKDTINGASDYNNVYFIDNYARSSENEDRARLFEYICNGDDLVRYPNLNAKIIYLKKVLKSNFPELEIK